MYSGGLFISEMLEILDYIFLKEHKRGGIQFALK